MRKTGRKPPPRNKFTAERNDRIKTREWACGFGRGPNIVKNRLISIGSHSHRERLIRGEQDGAEPSSFKGYLLGSTTTKSLQCCSYQENSR